MCGHNDDEMFLQFSLPFVLLIADMQNPSPRRLSTDAETNRNLSVCLSMKVWRWISDICQKVSYCSCEHQWHTQVYRGASRYWYIFRNVYYLSLLINILINIFIIIKKSHNHRQSLKCCIGKDPSLSILLYKGQGSIHLNLYLSMKLS